MSFERRTRWIVPFMVASVWTLAALSPGAFAEPPDSGTPRSEVVSETLTNESVVEMLQLGLGEEVVVEKIRGSNCAFDVSLEGLKALKEAGVPPAVLSEMVRAMARATASAGAGQAAPAQPTDPNDPAAPHEPGVYLLEEKEGTRKMTWLEPTVYTQAKTSNVLGYAFSGGLAKMKIRAVLNGSQARFRISSSKPTFYFYFPTITQDGRAQVVGTLGGASSPNEFVLVRMKENEKKGRRELVVGEMNIAGAKGGVMSETQRPFDVEKIAPGIYKVVPAIELEPGEYCFLYAGGAGTPLGPAASVSGKVYDFGVEPR